MLRLISGEEAVGGRRKLAFVTTTKGGVKSSSSEMSVEAAEEGDSEAAGLGMKGRGEGSIWEKVMRYWSFSSSEPAMVSQVETIRRRRSIEVAALGRGSGWVAGSVESTSMYTHRSSPCPSPPREGGTVAVDGWGREAEDGVAVIGATEGEDHAGLFLPTRAEGIREVGVDVQVGAGGGAAVAGASWVQAGWVGGGARGGRVSGPGGEAADLEEESRGRAKATPGAQVARMWRADVASSTLA